MIQRRQKKINIFPELFPQFVLKLDDHFEEDFSSLAEDVGLEDLDIGADAFRQTASPAEDDVKALFRQLTPGQVDDLVTKYRVDLEMFQYSPKQFYFWSKSSFPI